MLANLENSAVATGLEKVKFWFQSQRKAMPKNVQETPQLHLSHMLVKYRSKFPKPGFNNRWTMNFQMFKLDLEKAGEPETKLPTFAGSLKKQESSKNTSNFFFIAYIKAFDCVDHNKLWKILKERGIPDHMTCFLRNLYAGHEATVRTGHGTTDWFQIGKGVCQGCVILPCLFNLYAEFSSVTQSCPTLCDPMNCSTPGLPVHHQLPESTQTHVHS